MRLVLALFLLVFSAPLAAADNAAWLAKVEGFYTSPKNPTPFGVIPFAMDMIREADGAVHGRSWGDSQTYFDFKFWLNEKGELLFQETGALPGGFVQSHTLEVVKAEGETLTFETKKSPGVLVARVTADGNRLHVNTIVRGRPHADLDMQRVRDEKAIAGFRAENAKAKERLGGSALQQSSAATAQEAIDASLPKAEQSRRHVAEAQKIVAQMAKAAPPDMPGLAFKMKGHLDQAIALDGSNDEAHFQLAIWYLRAPEIAGGSRDKAREILHALEKIGSPRAAALRKEFGGH